MKHILPKLHTFIYIFLLSGVLMMFPFQLFAQPAIEGVVVGMRQNTESTQSLAIQTEGGVDKIEVKLPKKPARQASPVYLPDNWTQSLDGSVLLFEGEDIGKSETAHFVIDIGKTAALRKVKVTGYHDGVKVFSKNPKVRVFPKARKYTREDNIFDLPPYLIQGEDFFFQPTKMNQMAPGGSWTICGVVADQVPKDSLPVQTPKAPITDEAEEPVLTVTGVPFSTDDPVYRVTIPEGYDPARPVTFTYTDPLFYDQIVAIEDETVSVYPQPVAMPDDPYLVCCQQQILLGDTLCVTGWFPDNKWKGVYLNGGVTGKLVFGSSTMVRFVISKVITPGRHIISGDPELGFDPANTLEFEALQLHAKVDLEQLWLRGGPGKTEMHIAIEGTDEMVNLSMAHLTPGIIKLGGGDYQVLEVQGSKGDSLKWINRLIEAEREGNFKINIDLKDHPCACIEEDIFLAPPPPPNGDISVMIPPPDPPVYPPRHHGLLTTYVNDATFRDEPVDDEHKRRQEMVMEEMRKLKALVHCLIYLQSDQMEELIKKMKLPSHRREKEQRENIGRFFTDLKKFQRLILTMPMAYYDPARKSSTTGMINKMKRNPGNQADSYAPDMGAGSGAAKGEFQSHKYGQTPFAGELGKSYQPRHNDVLIIGKNVFEGGTGWGEGVFGWQVRDPSKLGANKERAERTNIRATILHEMIHTQGLGHSESFAKTWDWYWKYCHILEVCVCPAIPAEVKTYYDEYHSLRMQHAKATGKRKSVLAGKLARSRDQYNRFAKEKHKAYVNSDDYKKYLQCLLDNIVALNSDRAYNQLFDPAIFKK